MPRTRILALALAPLLPLAFLSSASCRCKVDCGVWYTPPDVDAATPDDVLAGCTATYDPTVADLDQPDLVFDVDRLQLPLGASSVVVAGLDVDDLASHSTSDASGCFVRDTREASSSAAANVDNAFSPFAWVMESTGLALSSAFQRAIDGPSPAVAIRIVLTHYNRAPDDPCVGVRVLAGEGVGRLALVGEGLTGLVFGQSRVMSGFSPIPLALHVVGDAACMPDGAALCPSGRARSCDAVIPLTLRGARLRLNVRPNATGGFALVTNQPSPPTDVNHPTLLAGILDWPFSPVNVLEGGTAEFAIAEASCQAGNRRSWPDVQSVARSKADLHVPWLDQSPTPCSGTSAASSNVNAMSIGFYLGDVD